MSNEVAIRVDRLSKVYRIGEAEQRHETLPGATISYLPSPTTAICGSSRASMTSGEKREIRDQRSVIGGQPSDH